MLIVCPSCATAYNVETANLSPEGRQVRCVRCRTVWHAEPSRSDKLLAAAGALAPQREVVPSAPRPPADDLAPAAAAAQDQPSDWAAQEQTSAGRQLAVLDPGSVPDLAGPQDQDDAVPDRSVEVEAPPIAPAAVDEAGPPIDIDAQHGPAPADEPPQDIETYAARRKRRGVRSKSVRWPLSRLQNGILALLIIDAVLVGWRDDVVRVMPQTASFYAMMGLGVNLRGLMFKDVRITSETVEGKPVLVIEGVITGEARKPIELPRLRFSVRDAQGAEIYAWNTVLEQPVLKPGEKAWFKSRLASPPPEGRNIDVRFFSKRDIAGGHA